MSTPLTGARSVQALADLSGTGEGLCEYSSFERAAVPLTEDRVEPAGTFARLPLWALVLLAARAVRRAALTLPAGEQRTLLEGCDRLVEAALAGGLERGYRYKGDSGPVGLALEAAVDAARAAEASLDFSAAETACANSSTRALAYAAQSAETSLQAAIQVASDVDQLRFATDEFGIGRYDPLTSDVLARLTPS
jgi:hypothetical protein